jgi:hypothetical protein
MTTVPHFDGADFRLEPDTLWKKQFYPLLESTLKFKKVDKFFLHKILVHRYKFSKFSVSCATISIEIK